jgi:regulator of replication initiation timing
MLVAHDGQVEVVPEHEVAESEAEEESFPPKVEVPKSFVREHERLELEAEHLREQLDEHKRYITQLREQLEATDQEVVPLEELDGGAGSDVDDDEPYQLG